MSGDRVAEALVALEEAVHPTPLYGTFVKRDGSRSDTYLPKPDVAVIGRAAPGLLILARSHAETCAVPSTCAMLAALADAVLGPKPEAQ
jgi:hypothetical protein